MEYLVNNHKYSLSYEELKYDYQEHLDMTDEEFFGDIPRVLHLVCIICYLKETSAHILLEDEGLIHQLVHMLDSNTKSEPLIDNPQVRREIRESFKVICELA